MILDIKQIWEFLTGVQMGHKVVETTCNINNGFDPGAANEHTVQWWFKKFYKEDESLDHEEPSGKP